MEIVELNKNVYRLDIAEREDKESILACII